MPLEVASYINGLVSTNPVSTDGLSGADDHLRLIKGTILNTFPNIAHAVTADHTEINVLDGITTSTAELNILTGATLNTAELNVLTGVTGVTSTEINYLANVTSDIQTQLSGINTSLINDSAPQLAADLDTNGSAVTFGNWSIEIDGSNYLTFSYSGNVKLRISQAGALEVEQDITAFAGI